MPPRKSNASTTAASTAPPTTSTPTSPTTTTHTPTAPAGADTSILSTTSQIPEPKSPNSTNKQKSSRSQQQQDDLGIDDLLLPRSLTSRIARGVLPPNTSLQKDAILALTKSATVFISFLASTANEQRPNAKTVTPQDVLKALQEMELEKVMGLGERTTVGGEDGEVVVGGRLERELAVFEEVVRGKRKGYREKVKARESGVGGGEGDGETGLGDDGDGDGEREAKRARRGGDEGDEEEEERDEEDALLDAQLNGQIGGGDVDDDEEEDVGDDPEEEDDEQQDEDETEEIIDAEHDELEGRRRNGSGSRGRSSILAPNGRAELGSDEDSD